MNDAALSSEMRFCFNRSQGLYCINVGLALKHLVRERGYTFVCMWQYVSRTVIQIMQWLHYNWVWVEWNSNKYYRAGLSPVVLSVSWWECLYSYTCIPMNIKLNGRKCVDSKAQLGVTRNMRQLGLAKYSAVVKWLYFQAIQCEVVWTLSLCLGRPSH